jgi:hypothetical protein
MSAFTLVYTRALQIENWYSDTVNIPYPNPVKTGSNDVVVANRLVDSTADFSSIKVGDTVFNSSDRLFAYVTGIINNTTLALSEDIFTASSSDYIIYQGNNTGCYLYIPTPPTSGLVLQVETIGGDIITFIEPPAGVLPVQVRKVMSGTTVYNLVALW